MTCALTDTNIDSDSDSDWSVDWLIDWLNLLYESGRIKWEATGCADARNRKGCRGCWCCCWCWCCCCCYCQLCLWLERLATESNPCLPACCVLLALSLTHAHLHTRRARVLCVCVCALYMCVGDICFCLAVGQTKQKIKKKMHTQRAQFGGRQGVIELSLTLSLYVDITSDFDFELLWSQHWFRCQYTAMREREKKSE